MADENVTWDGVIHDESDTACSSIEEVERVVVTLGERPDDPLRLGPVAEQDQGRDREHLVAPGGLLVVVDVEADDPQLAVALGRHLLEDRMDDAARPAPGSPEVDEHGPVGVDHLALKARVGYVGELAGHCCFSDLGWIRINRGV